MTLRRWRVVCTDTILQDRKTFPIPVDYPGVVLKRQSRWRIRVIIKRCCKGAEKDFLQMKYRLPADGEDLALVNTVHGVNVIYLQSAS